MTKVCDFEETVRQLFLKMLDQLPNVIQMIRLTKRWSHLELPCIDVPKTFLGLFMIFDEEIDHVRKIFLEWKVWFLCHGILYHHFLWALSIVVTKYSV